ncbi:MAG: SDR family oxidoreductase [Anaerolineaceae bacterium]|jgi:NAD(P)-dependent dehydrogenase (short-subunit alcohol dehydrogenase family)|nr:MAG: SDR family oxidoreductase [Anaerolineaceae bacterium]
MRLQNKIAIITGGTSGIGKATALRFADEGADLVVTGRRVSLGKAVEAECRSKGVRCVFVEADHSKVEDCQRVVDAALKEFHRIDILFNNAGIVTKGTAETTSEETWKSTIEINVTAVWRMSRLVIPVMKKQGRGAIVNNGSDWSVVAGKDAFPYIMSKGAVGMMTKAMALDYARDGIRVNAVCPGDTFVDRWMEKGYFEGSDPVTAEEAIKESSSYIPMGRFGKPEEIANAVVFLASDEASFVTGHLLLVDGGNTAQ